VVQILYTRNVRLFNSGFWKWPQTASTQLIGEGFDMRKLTRTPLFLPGTAIFVLGWVVIFNNLVNLT
jgi:hypothetical protein